MSRLQNGVLSASFDFSFTVPLRVGLWACHFRLVVEQWLSPWSTAALRLVSHTGPVCHTLRSSSRCNAVMPSEGEAGVYFSEGLHG